MATLAVKSEVLRVGFDAQPAAGTFSVPAPLQLVADLGARPLLVGPDGAAPNGLDQGGGVLDVVRVDGKKARLEGHVPHRALGWEREVLLNQQRIRVTDRTAGGAVALTWTFGPDWAIEGAGGAWTLRSGPYTVIVELPAALSWRLEGRALRGEGRCAAGEELRSGFEVRG